MHGRVNEGHVAVRFGDTDNGQRFRVTIDGEDVSLLVDEAIPGNPGAVHYVPLPLGDGSLSDFGHDNWLAGEVRVERT